MKDKELRRLNRKELLEIIVRQQQELEDIRSRFAEAKEQLDARCIRLDIQTPGSVVKAMEILTGLLKEDQA